MDGLQACRARGPPGESGLGWSWLMEGAGRGKAPRGPCAETTAEPSGPLPELLSFTLWPFMARPCGRSWPLQACAACPRVL